MDRYKIIQQVKQIILKHATPERIYLYGSFASGEHQKTSDIDIAYYDKNFLDMDAIEREVEKISTLLKIEKYLEAFRSLKKNLDHELENKGD